jgi:mono/diheme cytochrome c family protein
MPPYTAKVLSDAQLADIWAYVRTLPESRPAKDIPLLNER